VVILRTHQWVNFAAFQLAWLVAVWGASVGLWWFGPVAVAAWVSAYSIWRKCARVEAPLWLGAGLLGAMTDSLLVWSGAMAFPESAGPGFPTTPWMVALWINFAAALRHCMGWLCGRFVLATVFGAIGGPLAYLAGSKFGALEIYSLPAIVVAWLLVMPGLLLIEMKTRSRSGAGSGQSGKLKGASTPGESI
tara:strand:+ start:477 stop:1052 length:576 start_codon:yes stop_codon:yes gene_type:complete